MVIKYNSAGSILWVTTVGGGYTGNGTASSVVIDGDNNIYMTGSYFYNFTIGTSQFSDSLQGSDNPNFFICKLNKNGNWIWAKSEQASTHDFIGSALVYSNTNSLYAMGYFFENYNSSLILGNDTIQLTSGTQYILMKLDTSGTVSYLAQDEYSFWPDPDFHLYMDNSENLYIAGTLSESSIMDFTDSNSVQVISPCNDYTYVSKRDSTGKFLWYTLGTSNANINTYLCGGVSKSGYFLMEGNYTMPAIDSGIPFDNSDNMTIWTYYTPNDSLKWDIGDLTGNDGYELITSPEDQNGFYGLEIGSYSVGYQYVVRLDSLGNKQILIDSLFGYIYSLQVDSSQNIYMLQGLNLVKYQIQSTTGISQTETNNLINLYPNPTSGQFTINIPDNQNKYSVEIYNVLGEKIYQSVLSNLQNNIDLSNQSSGMYIVYLKSEGNIEMDKVVIAK